MIRTDPQEIWKEYEKGIDYNNSIDLYETVRVNRNFFLGRQWEGLNAPDLPKPVMNIMKRVIAYQTSMITSDDIGVSFQPFRPNPDESLLAAIFAQEVERVIEQAKIKSFHRDAIRNASVDGDACMYLYYDTDIETGQDVKGDIRVELIDNINVYFGNPYLCNVQKQPYIIIAQRKTLKEVKEESKQNGCDAESIITDSDPNQGEAGDDSGLVTVLIKFWKENGIVNAIKTTQTAIVRDKWDTGLKLYPIAWMPWETVRSSYHGQASITGLVPNQIAINRMYAMAIRSAEMNAFPKVVYDATKIERWSNRVGEAVAVRGGGVTDAIATAIRGADMSPQVMQIIETTVNMTRDFMGASDAALGNVRPDNTSAIIAVQQASSAPLDLQKRAFFDWCEDYVRIIIDMMRANYGTRSIVIQDGDILAKFIPPDPMTGEMPEYFEMRVDFGQLEGANMLLKVDVGSSAYWSEITQMQTLDNLVNKGIIQDPELFVEQIPNKYLAGKNKILESIRRAKDLQEQQMQEGQQLQNMQQPMF